MKNIVFRSLLFIMTIAILSTTLTPFAEAAEDTGSCSVTDNEVLSEEQGKVEYSAKDVEDLENVLKVLFDDAGVLDSKTESIKFKDSVLRKELSKENYNKVIGDLKKEDLLIEDVSSSGVVNEDYRPDWTAQMGGAKKQAYIDKCVGNKLSNTYGKKAMKAIKKLVLSKDYKKAAKELAKRGLKMSGTIYTLSKILGSCLYKASKKF